jgi:PHD/YefM family antitoxin component YafN of YafNO toxin-antitoxin module
MGIMKVLEINMATSPLEEYARNVKKEPLIVTKNGKPMAAVVALKSSDMETIKLSTDPRFMRLIARTRARHAAKGGMSGAEVRRSLGHSRTKRRKR